MTYSNSRAIKRAEICEKSGKVRFAKRRTALRTIKGIQRRGSDRNTPIMTAYECFHCDGWHIGHRKPGRRRRSAS
ncbi:hypothetical protein LCGC14_2819380 [marine sediment metagenome]|uniref:Uncharacterized protein n=1 Tax=marine sediment metagenome TaxID=412755 RepID=A0A0F8YHI0_9ZZZZ